MVDNTSVTKSNLVAWNRKGGGLPHGFPMMDCRFRLSFFHIFSFNDLPSTLVRRAT